VRGLTEPLAWWVAQFLIYLGIISTISATELIVGAAAAAVGSAAAVAARRALLGADNAESYLPRAAWLRWLAPIPGQVLRDSARLARVPLRGEFAEVVLPAETRAAAQRGLAALAISTPPGTYVAEVDPRRDAFTVHRLGPGPGAVERKITGPPGGAGGGHGG
jgi:multisubunit Na+/H+ antiporter MnhE subunit